ERGRHPLQVVRRWFHVRRRDRKSTSFVTLCAPQDDTSGVHRLALERPMQLELAVGADVDDDGVAIVELPVEDGHRQWILNQALNRAFERPCAEGGIVAFFGQHLLGFRCYEYRNLPIG